jgi:selenocysteine lyase/cysteine desulfurase
MIAWSSGIIADIQGAAMSLSRRDFTRLLALSGTASLFPAAASGSAALDPDAFDWTNAPLPQTPAVPNERFWQDVRARFLVPRDLAFLNAANLCPASLPAIEAHEQNLRLYEASPSPDVRSGLMAQGREESRKLLAEALRVTPEEIVITRNTTESNNVVSSGLDLKAGDEVVVWADNHPSNLNAWRTKAQRFGFTVVTVPTLKAHPGTAGYVELFTKAFTAKTKLVAVTHVSSNSGDLLPVAEICAAARDKAILSLVDGAQTFGVLDVNLSTIKPDFYSGSMHKWPCGPKEKGLLFVNRAVQDRLHPSIVGVYGGQVGISRTFEANGQRDDASIAAVTEALKFQGSIGRAVIEARSRQLARALMDGLRALKGVTLWTDPDPARSAAIVIFQPGTLDVRRLTTALTKDRIIVTARSGQEWPGLRIAPHFYNTMDDIDRTVGAIRKYLASGV